MKRHIERLESILGEAVSAVSVDKLKKGLKSGDYEYAGTTDGLDGNKYHVVHDLGRNSTMQYLATPKMKWIVKYEGAPSKRKKPDWTLRGKKVFDEDKGSEGLSEGRKGSFDEGDVGDLEKLLDVMDGLSNNISDVFGFRRLPYLIGNPNWKKLKQAEAIIDAITREVADDFIATRDANK